jgi:hypothetical protein
MIQKRNLKYKDILLALTLTIIIFVGGILLGNQLVDNKYNELVDATKGIQIETSSLELQLELLLNEPCKVNNTESIQDKIQLQGNRITYLESIYGTSSPEISELKIYYAQLQIKHWLFLKELQTVCPNHDKDIILYFYSNKECSKCSEQGTILTAYKEKYPDTQIYSFDAEIPDVLIQTMIGIYTINVTPSIIINDNTFNQFMSFKKLEQFIKLPQ